MPMSTLITRLPEGTRPATIDALCGVAAAALFFGVAEAMALLFGPASAPLAALGAAIVPLVPTSMMKFVIDLVGTSDKAVLIATVCLVVVILAAALGLVSNRRPLLALGGFLAAGILTFAAVAIRPEGTLVDLLPVTIGLVVGVAAFIVLRRLAVSMPSDRGPIAPPMRDRRAFLGTVGMLALAGSVTVALGRSAAEVTGGLVKTVGQFVLPKAAKPAPAVPVSATLGVPGVGPFITPQKDLYRIDTALVVPRVDAETWSLRIHGMVEKEVTLTMDDVLALPLQDRHVTLTCVSNPVGGDLIGTGTWRGYPLRELLKRANPSADADMVLSRSIDGFSASTPLEAMTDERDAMLVVGMNGQPLTPEHGYPARLVIPGLYGYVSATKWVSELQVTRFDREEAYWTRRGWDEKGPILVASRIEVPAPLDRIPPGNTVVAGVAWAQQAGIERVEVRLDEGEWIEADLGSEASIDTWRQWRHEFADVSPGAHAVTVRAVDANGTVQTGERRRAIPNTATGHHRIQFRSE